MKRRFAILLSLAIGSMAGLGAVAVVVPQLPRSPLVEGLAVGGERVPEGISADSWLRDREALLTERRLTLRYGEQTFEATRAAVGVRVDRAATLNRAQDVGHRGSIWTKLEEAKAARRGEVNVPIVYRLDGDVARSYLRRLAPKLAVAPVDAEIDLAGHRIIPDKAGRQLDIPASLEELLHHKTADEPIDLITKVVPAKVTVHDLGDIAVDKVLATFETHYSIYKKGRSANVELATKNLNGLVIRPGAVVSFNDRVGPRTTEAGFKQAPEIVGDELTIGIGGGTCQVSSTLHGAALYGGMDVVSRKSHSRPSSYTKLGLDATVAYPRVDLKLRNPFRFPIIIHAFIPKPGTLRIELLGGEAVKEVKYVYGISSIEEYVRRITVKPFLKPGRKFRKQKGTRGMDVFSTVTIHYQDGRKVTKRYYSGYRATPEVYWVAPDVDDETLPPLPAHAKGIEGHLDADGSDVYPTAG